MDAPGPFVTNVIIGTLEIDDTSQIFLLYSMELEKTNCSTIFKLFNKAMGIV